MIVCWSAFASSNPTNTNVYNLSSNSSSPKEEGCILGAIASSFLCAVDVLEEFESYDVELPQTRPGEGPKYHPMSVHIGIGVGLSMQLQNLINITSWLTLCF
jgi:hypothetical protein